MTDQQHDGRRSARRRHQAIAGAVGVAAVLGGAALIVTGPGTRDPARYTGPGTPAPFAQPFVARPADPAASPAPGTARRSPALGTSPAPGAGMTSPATVTPKTIEQLIGEVKGTAAKATADVIRPLVPPARSIPDSEVTVTEARSPKGGGTLRVVSARGDLTGQRELSWVAGQKGRPVGDANCSRKIKLTRDKPAVERPTLLVCWRTSAGKSVFTVAVNPAGRPSERVSVSALGKVWDKL